MRSRRTRCARSRPDRSRDSAGSGCRELQGRCAGAGAGSAGCGTAAAGCGLALQPKPRSHFRSSSWTCSLSAIWTRCGVGQRGVELGRHLGCREVERAEPVGEPSSDRELAAIDRGLRCRARPRGQIRDWRRPACRIRHRGDRRRPGSCRARAARAAHARCRRPSARPRR